MIISFPLSRCRKPATQSERRRVAYKRAPAVQPVSLLAEAIERGLEVKTMFRPDAPGVEVPERARRHPLLAWNVAVIGDMAHVQNDTIVSWLRFDGKPQLCRVPLSSIVSWKLA